jgi:2-hydroxychromene-2-carboxylate isomerase
MAKLTFYFDMVCPWAWRTSQWIRQVRQQQELEVEWRFFSLAEANNMPDPLMRAPLRAAVLARREGGNEAVDKLYQVIGNAIHSRGIATYRDGMPMDIIKGDLEAAGLEAAILDRALDDASTLSDMQTEHAQAVAKYKAYGVPWLIVDENDFGFNGPVMTEVPQGETALKLWESLSWVLTQPYFYELKRNRS